MVMNAHMFPPQAMGGGGVMPNPGAQPLPPIVESLFAKYPQFKEQIMRSPELLETLITRPEALAEAFAAQGIDLMSDVPEPPMTGRPSPTQSGPAPGGSSSRAPANPPIPPAPSYPSIPMGAMGGAGAGPGPMGSPDDMMAMGAGAAAPPPGQAGGIDLGAMIQQGMQYLQQLGQAPAQGMQSPDDMMAMGQGAAMPMPGAAQAGPPMGPPSIPMGAMQGMPAAPPQAGPPAGPGAGPSAGGGIPPAVVAAAQAMGAGGGAGAAPQIPPATGAAPGGGGEVDQLGQILQAVGSAYEAPPQPGTPAPPRPGSVPGNPGFLQMLGSTMGNHPIPSLGALIGLGLMMK